MTTYRPIADTWILARAKLKDGAKYYGAYPGGFLHRARALLGVSQNDPVLHVCGGMVRAYPYSGLGPNDRTLDADPALCPDFLTDAREPYPSGFAAVLADPPYSKPDADHYKPGASFYPSPRVIVSRALAALPPGGRVGILHVVPPRPPAGTRFVAAVTVIVGFDNAVRMFSVFEKPTSDTGTVHQWPAGQSGTAGKQPRNRPIGMVPKI
jgi:hypothetical protein